jgi:hypothetical protein
MIGERFGLPKEIDMRKILSEIQSIELTERKDGKTSSYTFHLANCSIDPDYENKTKEQIIGECFTKTDQAWFRKMAQLIIDSTTEISLDQRYRGQYDIKSYLRKRNDEPALGRVGVLANNFFKLYLLGKRKEERCTALVAAAC